MSKGNFKVRCIDLCGCNGSTYTVGKVYEVIDGYLISNRGSKIGFGCFANVNDVNGFSSSKFEAVSENPTQTITIRQKGRKVIAVLTDADGKFIKSAKAKCSPEDEFDFEIGAKLAVSRLLGIPIESAKPEITVKVAPSYRIVKQDKYEVGDKVKVREDLVTGAYGDNSYLDHRMGVLKGKTATIIQVTRNGKYYRFEETGWWDWTREMFEGKVIEATEPTVKEVKRPAKVGEWIKVVDAKYSMGYYKNGDILRVKSLSIDAGDIDAYISEDAPYIAMDEYIVLENYQPEEPTVKEEPKPFRKAKVDDKIKVVADKTYHVPKIKNGDVQIVTEVRINGVCTAKGNMFCDTDQEYIIIEEAPESKKSNPFFSQSTIDEVARYSKPLKTPEDTEIMVGDTVKVVDNGQSWSAYKRWFHKYEPRLANKFANRCPRNGFIGTVIARHYSDTEHGTAYAIQENSLSEIYLIGRDGIKKVK